MQFSLRSLLISFAVAGTGAGVFCVWYRQWFFEPDTIVVAAVVVAFFAATLFGLMKARAQTGLRRLRLWLFPPLIVSMSVVLWVRLQTRNLMFENVMSAERACLRFAEAEEEYHKTDWNNDGVLEYTPSLKELRAKLAAKKSTVAIEQGMADAEWPSSRPFHGYFFKIFKSQRFPIARSYVDEHGRMTQGYALIAWPARYEWTGVDQMMISNSGTLYNGYLGDPQVEYGENMTEFAPVAPYWHPD